MLASSDTLEAVVTACCGRDVSWLGDLFSTGGLVSGRRRAPAPAISLSSLVGDSAYLSIYDKGGDQESCKQSLARVRSRMSHPQRASCTALRNAPGREAHTIAYHIAERYHSLATVTIFLHGDDSYQQSLAPLSMLYEALLRAQSSEASAQRAAGEHAARNGILRRVVREVHRAEPSTGAASLCPEGPLMPLCEDQRSPWQCPQQVRPGHNAGSYSVRASGPSPRQPLRSHPLPKPRPNLGKAHPLFAGPCGIRDAFPPRRAHLAWLTSEVVPTRHLHGHSRAGVCGNPSPSVPSR